MSIKQAMFEVFGGFVKKGISCLIIQKQVFIASYLLKNFVPEFLVTTGLGSIKFCCPNNICLWRARMLLSKEPETIEWINNFGKDSMFWDIGANIGIYSLYAALMPDINVLAFEPFVNNYYVLNKNIMLNKMSERINSLCVAFSDKSCLSCFNVSDIEIGSALHHFDKEANTEEKCLPVPFKQGMIGLSIDEFIDIFNPIFPNYIKIDVDGFEDRIVRGAQNTLSDKRLKSILVELDSARKEHCDKIDVFLKNCGMRLSEKRHGPMFDSGEFQTVYNYIYTRA